jgi:5'-3' exonuclease
MIHKISNTVTEDINDLLMYSLIYKYSNQSGMDKDLLIDEFTKIYKKYNFKYSIDEFYKHNKDIDLNKIIFEHIFENIRNYLTFYPNCELLYIGIDGVPSVGKMVEQQDRRYKGYLMSLINKKLIEKHKNQLNNSNFDFTNIYNELEYLNLKLSFDKNLISPQTDFMIDFINELKKQDFKVKTVISDFNEKGEGEKKIVKYIKLHSKIDDRIVIYSPDADMIIMTMIFMTVV